MARNRQSRMNRKVLLTEAKALHDMSVGPGHCDPKYLGSCAAYQQLIPQAAENVRKGRTSADGAGLPRV